MNRTTRDDWAAAGSPEIADLAYAKSLEILETAKPEPRSESLEKELDRIYVEFEERVKERKAKAVEKK